VIPSFSGFIAKNKSHAMNKKKNQKSKTKNLLAQRDRLVQEPRLRCRRCFCREHDRQQAGKDAIVFIVASGAYIAKR